MEEPREEFSDQPEEPAPSSIGRRQLLKALGATAGALAAAQFLPDSWVKPAIAAAPPGFRIDALSTSGGEANFVYHDANHQLTDANTLMAVAAVPGFGETQSLAWFASSPFDLRRHGGPAGGDISFSLTPFANSNLVCNASNPSSYALQVQLRTGVVNGSGGWLSNQLSALVPCS